jgi:putative transposase
MSKKRYRPKEIIGKLREADVLIRQSKKGVDVIKNPRITDVTYSRWRQENGGMSVSQARRLKKLDKENKRLRKGSYTKIRGDRSQWAGQRGNQISKSYIDLGSGCMFTGAQSRAILPPLTVPQNVQ